MQGANKLLQDIKKKFDTWNERSMFQLAGVKNLSYADLEALELYARTAIETGNVTGYGRLMKPLGNIADVLAKYSV